MKPVLTWAVTTALLVGQSVTGTNIAVAEHPPGEEKSSSEGEGEKKVEKRIQIKVVGDGGNADIAETIREQLEAANVSEEVIEKALAGLKKAGQVKIASKDGVIVEEETTESLKEELADARQKLEMIELSIVDQEGIAKALKKVGKLRIKADVEELSQTHKKMVEAIKKKHQALSQLHGAGGEFQWSGSFEFDDSQIVDMLKEKGVDEEALGQLKTVLGRMDKSGVSEPKFRIGIALKIDNDGEEAPAIEVDSVFDDSPASKAGLKEGDVIVKAGKVEIGGADQLLSIIQENGSAGKKIPLIVNRDGGVIEIEVAPEKESAVLAKAPEEVLNRIGKMTPGASYAFVVDGDKTVFGMQPETEKVAKGQMKGVRKEIDELKKDVAEIKSMLKQLLDK